MKSFVLLVVLLFIQSVDLLKINACEKQYLGQCANVFVNSFGSANDGDNPREVYCRVYEVRFKACLHNLIARIEMQFLWRCYCTWKQSSTSLWFYIKVSSGNCSANFNKISSMFKCPATKLRCLNLHAVGSTILNYIKFAFKIAY